MKVFFTGLSYNITGFKYFMTNKSLWKYTLIPFIINLLALILLVSLYIGYFDPIFHYISSPLSGIDVKNPESILWNMADAGLWIVRGLFKVVFFLLCLLVIFVGVYFTSSLINSPFYEAMAEKILNLKGVLKEESFNMKIFLNSLGHSLKIELYKIIFFILIALVLFLLGWIPAIGPFFSFLGFLFASWVFALGLSTFPMVLKKKSFGEILKWAYQNKALLIGFGLPSTIPFLGLMFMSFQVVGGTLMHIDFAYSERSDGVVG